MIGFNEFIQSYQRPGITEISFDSVKTKPVSELEKLSVSEAGEWVGICDNAVWLAQSPDQTYGRMRYFSGDGEFVYFFSLGNKNCLKYLIGSSKKMELVGTTELNFKKDEGDKGMAESNEMVNVKELLNSVTPPGVGGSDGKMTAFGGGGAGAGDEAKPARGGLTKDAISETMNKIRNEARSSGVNDDISLLKAAWQKSAELLCWVTPNDARDSIAAVKVNVPPEKREVVPNAPDSVRMKFSKDPKSVDSQYIKQIYTIQAKRSKPGKPAGAIIRIPAYLKGKSVNEYMQEFAMKGPQSPEDGMAVLDMLTFSDFEQKLTLVGGSIREAAETHGGAPSELVINYSVAKSRAKADSSGLTSNEGTVLVKKVSRVGGGNKTVLSNGNYFPLTTYETYDIYGNLSQDLVDKLNISCFESLVNGGKSTPAKIKLLVQDQQDNIKQEGDKITSKYITNSADRIKLEVAEFFDKDKARDSIQIPLKLRKEKSDGTTGALGFVKYSVLADAKKLADPEYFSKTSLGNGRFQHLIELTGPDFLNQSSLKMFKRGGGTGISKSLDALQARALLKSKLLGKGFSEFEVEGLKIPG